MWKLALFYYQTTSQQINIFDEDYGISMAAAMLAEYWETVKQKIPKYSNTTYPIFCEIFF